MTMTFKNDEDFIAFAINPDPIYQEIEGTTYYSFNLSDNYYNCIKKNITFVIEDPHSSIRKNKEFTYRLVTFKIKNIV